MKKINWRYAVGEILLIFIGITLAIAFQNWNENRKQSKVETAVLEQLKVALQNDLRDVNSNIDTHKRAMASCQNILQSLTEKKPIEAAEITNEMVQAVDFTFLISDVSTYEYLKSVGLHIIQNDTLRRQITNLYGVVYQGVYGVEKNSKPTQQDVIRGFRKYFTSNANSLVPIGDINEAKNDDALRFDVKTLQFSHQLMIKRYQQKIKPELDKLIDMIEVELIRLS